MKDENQGERRLSAILRLGTEDRLLDSRHHTSLKFITGVRCLYGVLVLIYSLLWYYIGRPENFASTLTLLLVSTTEIFVFTALCCVALLKNRLIRTVTYIGMAHDVLLAAFIVVFTGYQGSPFSYLFLIIPLYGGITLQRKGGIVGASIVSIVLLGVYLSLPLWLGHLPEDMAAIFYASSGDVHAGMSRFLAIALAAFAVGVLTGQLAYQYANAQKVILDNALTFRHLRGIYEHILNTMPVGVIIQNPETCRILYANPMAEKVFGRDLASDGEGSEGHALRDMSEILASADASESGEGTSTSWVCERDGSYYRVSEFELPLEISNESELLRGYQVSNITMEMLAQIEKNKRQRLELLGEFSAKIAHEIRNPLTCISGCNEMLQSEIKDASQLQIMEMMGCEIDRLNSLLNDILVFSRRPKLSPESVRVRDLLDGQWQLFSKDEKNADMAFECTVPEDMVVLYDGNSLRQIVMTLWRNSSEAVSGKGSVRVRGVLEPPALFFSDSGPGLSEVDAHHAFEPFFTTKKTGTGLGLSTARQLAIDNGSELSWDGELREFSLKFGE